MIAAPRYNIVTLISPPFVMYNQSTNIWSGYCIDLINEIRKIMSFDYVIQYPSYSEVGDIDFETGEWNGTIKQLMENNADIAIGPIWVTAARKRVVDFTDPIFESTGFSILMLRDQNQWPFLKFLHFLDYNVWISFTIAFFVTALLIFLFERHSPFSYRNSPEEYENVPDDRFCTLKGCFWYVATCITPEGGGDTPKNLSGKLAAATWWLFGFVIVAVYTANLAGQKTLDRLQTQIRSLDDLRRQDKVEYTVIQNSSAEKYFRNRQLTESLLLQLWQEMSLNESASDTERAHWTLWEYPLSEVYTATYFSMLESGFVQNMDEALKKMRDLNRNRGFAIVSEAVTIKYLVATNCDLTEVGEQFAKKPFAFVVQRGSPLVEKLNIALRVMKKQGKIEMLRRKWWDDNSERADCSPNVQFNDGMDLDSLAAIFVIIGIGICLALAILTLQYWWYFVRTKQTILFTPSSLTTCNP